MIEKKEFVDVLYLLPVKPCEYLLAHRVEVLWKWDLRCDGEDAFVVDLRLYPVHQQTDVLVGWQWGRLLVPRKGLKANVIHAGRW